MKYNLATVINKLGMNMKNDSIHKVRQPFPRARIHLLLLTCMYMYLSTREAS